jgi:hypothetical protein
MSTETNFEERWSELFANLTPAQHEQAVAACWYVLNDGFPLERESVERITTLLVDDPQQFAILYGPYTEADDTRYAELAERAECGELRVKPGATVLRGEAAAAEVRRLLADASEENDRRGS